MSLSRTKLLGVASVSALALLAGSMVIAHPTLTGYGSGEAICSASPSESPSESPSTAPSGGPSPAPSEQPCPSGSPSESPSYGTHPTPSRHRY
jgi:hypothetical protein